VSIACIAIVGAATEIKCESLYEAKTRKRGIEHPGSVSHS